jgi:hypothetical protein
VAEPRRLRIALHNPDEVARASGHRFNSSTYLTAAAINYDGHQTGTARRFPQALLDAYATVYERTLLATLPALLRSEDFQGLGDYGRRMALLDLQTATATRTDRTFWPQFREAGTTDEWTATDDGPEHWPAPYSVSVPARGLGFGGRRGVA